MPIQKTRNHGTMSDAAFFGWIRSGLRRLSIRWKPRNEYLKSNRREKKNGGRSKWEYQCELCTQWFIRAHVECDHRVSCGSLKTFEDLAGFCRRLFVEVDGWRILCKECHLVRTKLDKS